MSLGTQEQRTEGMKKQAIELIEQAYNRGFKAGQERAMEMEISKYIDKGRNEAWEAADKLNRMTLDEVIKVFADDPLCHTITRERIFTCCTPSCAIKKLHDYEMKKKEEKDIKVGDEVIYNSIAKGELRCCVIGNDGRRYLMLMHESFSVPQIVSKEDCKRTGRRFPEVNEILKKLGGDFK